MKSELFISLDGLVRLDVLIDKDDSIWVTQIQMAELFGATKQNISLHIKNLLLDDSFQSHHIKRIKRTSSNNKKYTTNHYSFEIMSNIALRAGIIDRYEEFCKWCGNFLTLPNQIYVQKRREYYFKDLLYISLKGVCQIYYQYPIKNYILDFFIPEYKIIVEYDEIHHKKRKISLNDSSRENEILKLVPDAIIIRVISDYEVQGLNKIILCVVNKSKIVATSA